MSVTGLRVRRVVIAAATVGLSAGLFGSGLATVTSAAGHGSHSSTVHVAAATKVVALNRFGS